MQCAGGCGFFGTKEKQGYCSQCYENRSNPQLANQRKHEKTSRALQRELLAMDFLARNRDTARTTQILENLIQNSESIKTPLQLWEALEDADSSYSVWLTAKEAVFLFEIYETRPDNGWLYGHVIGCRIVDNWNISGCNHNTEGYHQSHNVLYSRDLFEGSGFESRFSTGQWRGVPGSLAARWTFTFSQVESFGS